MAKKLIVNADDFGIHEAVNRAVCRGFESGILTSTSLMAGGRAFDEAVKLAGDMKGVGIGIHLTLVGGLETVLPPEEVPSLTWEGGRLCSNYMELIQRDLKGRIRMDDVYREWDAQIRKILDTGLPVTHIDGHQHMHMWNHFFPITLTLAKKYHIPCMRVPDEKVLFGFSPTPGGLFRFAAKNGLSLMARSHRKALKKAGIRTNDHFWGMMYGGHFYENRMISILGRVEDGVTEFMCHPSADREAMEETFHWGYEGEEELKSLTSASVRKVLEERKIQLVSYRDLQES
ncbi:ChbG/HpnK family deacetylase [uncultured Dialister sp.]|jgi:hopanoid biosynthesis associated protein HpnK|uniref:ChbG/HpnK family deacetylase n=1 Tax=uncultured Dialister sp. TaxID=278064 RepID=UPI0025F6D829|nr:ChbG/HpnK family deacetylase [uncultured Dialister sp.]